MICSSGFERSPQKAKKGFFQMISVIMPIYNGEKTVCEAVGSVLAQSYRAIELLVIDDASSDGTTDAVRKTAEKAGIPVFEEKTENAAGYDPSEAECRTGIYGQPPYVRILRNSVNRGAAGSRNAGVRAAAGEYIAFLDGDDRWDPEKLQKQSAFLTDHPDAGLIFTGSAFMNEDGSRRDYILHVPETITRKELLLQNLISCSSVLVSKDLMRKYPMPEEGKMHEDYVSWLGILQEIPCAYGIDEPLLIYRISGSSKSGNKARAALLNWRALRRAGLSVPAAAASMCAYTLRGLRKWRNLK